MYHCHNTKHVHVPLSQHKTCTRTTVTTQNMCTYNCHNTKHVHVPLLQYKTCTPIPLGTININAYLQDTGLLGCFAPETSNFAVTTLLVYCNFRRQGRVCIYIRTMKEQTYLGIHFINGFPYISTHLQF